jgi:DNA repair protein RadC
MTLPTCRASLDVVDDELTSTLFMPPNDYYYSSYAASNSSLFRFHDEPFPTEEEAPLPLESSPALKEVKLTARIFSKLKSLPPQDRPRERLAQMGSDALSTIELLAILLGNGTKNCSVLQLAAHLMARFGTLLALSEASVQELSSLKGIGFAKAVQLKAAFSLHARLPIRPIDKVIFDKASKIFELIGPELKKEKVEVLMVILLDARKRFIHREIAAKGILNEILIHPREIFHLAIKHRAHSIVVAHNHPSGDPLPSQQDLKVTEILKKSGEILGIKLSDHLIIAGENYISLAEKNFL